jgi:exodeoxyribonuclease V gamma subunit
MIRLTYSNRSEELLAALVENLERRRRRPGSSIFDATHLVVPNGNVETFLKLGLARATGIAAHLEVRWLRRFVAGLLERSHPDLELVDAPRLHGLLLALFHDERQLVHPDLEEVRRYLAAAGGSSDALDLRRFQLSRQVALLFDEYVLSRPEMLDAWLRGESVVPEHADAERWQRRLWQALFQPGGIVERRAKASGRTWKTLHACFQRIDPRRLAVPDELHVFGISYVARLFQTVLQALATRSELYVYTLNPCMEFWEDVEHRLPDEARGRFPHRARRGSVDGDDPFQLERAGDTPALRLWGRPGRENVRLLNELSDCDFTPRFVDPFEARPSLLTRLQHDILVREPERTERVAGAQADGSIQLFACPGVRREVEIIASEIWKLVRADEGRGGGEPLRFNDVAVIVPPSQKDAYQTHLAAVFREMHDLPHSLVDLPLSASSRVVEAVELLLELPLGEFRRQEVLRLATHPSVLARFPDAAPTRDEWIGWCESLGIVHGADHADHAGTYIARDILNWDQGMRRLALGAFLSGGATGPLEQRPFELGGEAYLPEEVPPSRVPSAASFGLLVRSLISDARFARDARLELPAWIRFLRGLLSSYLAPAGEYDDRALQRCHQALQSLEEMDLDGQAVSYRVAAELAKAAIGGLSGSRGQYLAGGVVVASFLPMRAIPFRVVFVAGLGEGQFPSSDRKNHLDLRLARRRPGDVSPREQDKYLFLETLLCARERLYLSYVAREALTGEPLAPSSVVVELLQMLDRGYVPREALERKFPLRRHLDEHTRFASLAAAREAQAQALGDDLRGHLGSGAPELAELRDRLAPDVARRLGDRLGVTPPPPPAAALADTLLVPAAAIRKFLECPLQGAARYLLGLREEDDEDLTARADEPFATRKLDLMIGLRELFLRTAPLDERAVEAAYQQLAEASRLAGTMPSGIFADAERPLHLRILAGWRTLFDQIIAGGGGRRPPLQVVRFGAAEEHVRVDELLDAIRVPIRVTVDGQPRDVEVRLYGRTDALVESTGSLVLVQRTGEGKEAAARDFKDSLRGFLDQVMLAASGRPPATYHTFIANVDLDGGPSLTTVPVGPIAPDEARSWLRDVLQDMLGGVHDYCLPCEAVFAHTLDPARDMADVVDELRGNSKLPFSSRFGPVPRGDQRPSPDDAAARRMIDRRFGLFLARRSAP